MSKPEIICINNITLENITELLSITRPKKKKTFRSVEP